VCADRNSDQLHPFPWRIHPADCLEFAARPQIIALKTKDGLEGEVMKLSRISLLILTAAVFLGTSKFSLGQDAGEIYKSKCQACHGADGKGDTPVGKKLGVRDLHSAEVTKESDDELFDITKKGKNKMPSYDGKLKDDQIKELIKYIRSLK
jgi:cytochrome c6